jgi:LPS export ABC transporter protein LptC
MKVLYYKRDLKIRFYPKTNYKLLSTRLNVLIILFVIVAQTSCESRKELLNQEIYNGPTMKMANINTMMTDSGKLILRLRAPDQLQFKNGNKSWPSGLILEYYSTPERPAFTFRSNLADFNAKGNLYKGEGNVIVKNLETGDQLNTELLFWSPGEEKFYTDNFVTIISEGEVHTGKGLSANQDFSSYKILEPAGTIQIEEDKI